jgi:hypothetical protein
MGTTLTGTTPQDTYDSLIKVTDNGPLSGTLKALSDGLGNDSTLSLSTTAASIAGTLAVSGNATFDTNTLFVDASNNRVGVGTATPSVALDVDGDVLATNLEVTTDVTLAAFSDSALAVDASGVVKAEPNFQNLSAGEGYAANARAAWIADSYSIAPSDIGYQYAGLIQKDLLNSSSLAIMPSGYKSTEVAAAKPLDGSGDLTFARASSATRVNENGLIESVTNDIPRMDYTGSSTARLLIEPQRTNLALFSEQFDNAYWGKEEISVTANNSTAPDNTISADKIIPSTTASAHHLSETVIGAAHSFSIFAKAGGYSTLNILYTVHNAYATFNLSAGTVTETNGTATAKIENYGNGWYRCTVTTSSTTHTEVRIYAINGTTFADRDTAGNGTNGIQLWGAQLEAGAYATSYIPTLGTSVTRVADAASKTGISSLIGQTEGTLFIDFQYNQPSGDSNGRLLQVESSAGEATDSIVPLITNGNQFQISISAGGAFSTPVFPSASTVVPFGRQKFAIAYNAGVYTVYRNGSLFASGTGGSPSSLSVLSLGNAISTARSISNPINQALLFKTRLTNAQLAELTA